MEAVQKERTEQTSQNHNYRERLFYDLENIAVYREDGELYQEDLDSGDTVTLGSSERGEILEKASQNSWSLEELKDNLE